MKVATENFDRVEIVSTAALRSWLALNHQQTASIWLVTYKKSVPSKYVSRFEILDELICFGWIDGIRRKYDEERTMQLISPRKVQHWAKSYKERAAALIADGKMHASGYKSIALSKEKGLWDFMDDVDNLVVPEDLRIALNKLPNAMTFFNGINDSSKRFVLRWLKLAKTAKTRNKRIDTLAALSAKGEKLPGS